MNVFLDQLRHISTSSTGSTQVLVQMNVFLDQLRHISTSSTGSTQVLVQMNVFLDQLRHISTSSTGSTQVLVQMNVFLDQLRHISTSSTGSTQVLVQDQWIVVRSVEIYFIYSPYWKNISEQLIECLQLYKQQCHWLLFQDLTNFNASYIYFYT